MTDKSPATASRRDFLKRSGITTSATALAAAAVPRAFAAEDNTIKVALVGCGGRGTGAASNALSVPNGNTRLVAMADVFEDRLASSYGHFERAYKDRVSVTDDTKFIGSRHHPCTDTRRPVFRCLICLPYGSCAGKHAKYR